MCSSNEAFTDHSARFSFTFKLRGFLLWEAGNCLTSINMVRMWILGWSWCLDSPESLIKSHAYYFYNQKVLTMFEKQLDGQMAQEKRDNGYLSVKARWRFVVLNLDLLYDEHPSTDKDFWKSSVQVYRRPCVDSNLRWSLWHSSHAQVQTLWSCENLFKVSELFTTVKVRQRGKPADAHDRGSPPWTVWKFLQGWTGGTTWV